MLRQNSRIQLRSENLQILRYYSSSTTKSSSRTQPHFFKYKKSNHYYENPVLKLPKSTGWTSKFKGIQKRVYDEKEAQHSRLTKLDRQPPSLIRERFDEKFAKPSEEALRYWQDKLAQQRQSELERNGKLTDELKSLEHRKRFLLNEIQSAVSRQRPRIKQRVQNQNQSRGVLASELGRRRNDLGIIHKNMVFNNKESCVQSS
ncbi:unnamed protein product [Ambrosiozyma monospora]|uniref:Unnamed protein product n=1 Tax=Ambrosiozyma monospora TaxID=43982 RepID=A0ACB5UB17_AMBMO|nr:unnamed protein product [Ambrosiozyma monospora]